jgi:hypothetical protein
MEYAFKKGNSSGPFVQSCLDLKLITPNESGFGETPTDLRASAHVNRRSNTLLTLTPKDYKGNRNKSKLAIKKMKGEVVKALRCSGESVLG